MLQLGPLVILLYLCGLGLDSLCGTAVFRALPALWLILIQPGWLFLSILNIPGLGRIEKYALSVPFSLAWIAVTSYVIHAILHVPISPHATILEVVLSPLLLSIPVFFIERPILTKNWLTSTTKKEISRILRAHWPLFAAIALYSIVHIGNFLLYPYLPEADGYSLIVRLREGIESNSIGSLTYRPLFTLYCILLSEASGLDPLATFKYLFPLLLASCAAYPYLLARRFTKEPILHFFAASLLVVFPVVVLETDVTRPQLAVLLSTFAVIWLLIRFRETISWRYLLTATLLAGIGIGFHELSFFSLFAVGVTAAKPLFIRIRTYPQQSMWLSIGIAIAIFPYLKHPGILLLVPSILGHIWQGISAGHIAWWFISSYRNFDGNNLGWPGYQSFLYYGYNLGITAPFLILAAIFIRRKKVLGAINLTGAWGLFAIAFFFAEVSPRFYVAYLPDRAWLFVSVSLIFLLVPTLLRLQTRKLRALFALSCILSISTSWLVTYLKEGWVHPAEYQAAEWITGHTSTTSLFLTQAGNIPLIQVYARRQALSSSDFFFKDHVGQVTYATNLNHQPLTTASQSDLESVNAHLDTLITSARAATSLVQLNSDESSLNSTLGLYFQLRRGTLVTQPPVRSTDTYIMYSMAKFDGLYGKRSWWQAANAEGASLTQLDQAPFKEVYNKGGVTIWKLTDSSL